MKSTVIFLLTVLLVFLAAGIPAAEQPVVCERSSTIDRLVTEAIDQGLIAGGVVLVGSRDQVLFERAYGRVSALLDAPPMSPGTVFDLASLTKVLATAPSIMKLAETGKISLVDPVDRWLPEFAGKGKDSLRIYHLLTHTSGLNDLSPDPANPLHSLVSGAALQKLHGTIGSRFHYADINFILLGEIVRRVTGEGLDRFSRDNIFSPLGMRETGFNPEVALIPRCSPTLSSEFTLLLGTPQDYQSRLMDGVAGHAGLFGTTHDLARFCRMLLEEGELDGTRILSDRAIRQMTAPYFSRGGAVARGLGWDMASPFSAPRGNGFSELSYGHTGYSGASIWIDPETDMFVVFLSARLDFKRVRAFSQLRSNLSTAAAGLRVPCEIPSGDAAAVSGHAGEAGK